MLWRGWTSWSSGSGTRRIGGLISCTPRERDSLVVTMRSMTSVMSTISCSMPSPAVCRTRHMPPWSVWRRKDRHAPLSSGTSLPTPSCTTTLALRGSWSQSARCHSDQKHVALPNRSPAASRPISTSPLSAVGSRGRSFALAIACAAHRLLRKRVFSCRIATSSSETNGGLTAEYDRNGRPAHRSDWSIGGRSKNR